MVYTIWRTEPPLANTKLNTFLNFFEKSSKKLLTKEIEFDITDYIKSS